MKQELHFWNNRNPKFPTLHSFLYDWIDKSYHIDCVIPTAYVESDYIYSATIIISKQKSETK